MKASVIVCSHNRVDSLLETLDSIVAMEVSPAIDWEIIVVDNASTDRTAERVRAWAQGVSIPVLVLEESRPGKAFALNLAVSHARADVLVLTDDDALVSKTWLTTALQSLEKHGADCVGGPVLPCWLTDRPLWLSDRLLNVLAMLDHGPKVRHLRLEDAAGLYGVNYALRKEVVTRVGGFDTTPWVRGTGPEDSEMVYRVQVATDRVFYDPRMTVQHKVFPERVTRAYYRRWHHNAGRDRAGILKPGGRRVLGLEAYMLRGFAQTIARLAGAAIKFESDEVFYQELISRVYLSYIRKRLRQYRSGTLPAPRWTPPASETAVSDRQVIRLQDGNLTGTLQS